ncbi:MAG: carboxypeptidase regulatory-like domain-containing protein [Polyangiaceae bacterium]|nr:carboxypeptidase regulatory-like domain-containing protein [Polyangiaceae bacterium]
MFRGGDARTRNSFLPLHLVAALLVMLVSSWASAQASKPAGAVRIQVRGGAQIGATATIEGSATIVRGHLMDDAGAVLGGVPITLQVIAPDGSPGAPLPLPSPCDSAARRERRTPRIASADKYEVRTDDHGEFCIRAEGTFGKASLKLRFDGDPLHDATESAISFDSNRASVAHTLLRFEPPPDVIDLERPSVSLTASLRVDRAASQRSTSSVVRREGLVVVLEDERGERIAEQSTGGDGRVRFELPTKAFAGPGAGELRLRFDGTTVLAKATASQPIVRRADVALSLSHPVDVGDPDDGVPIDVDVKTLRGPVTGGVVEALRGDESVGAGEVRDGVARVIASFSFERAGTVPLKLRYVPSAPFFRAGKSLDIEISVRGPGMAKQIAIALVVLAVTAWIVIGWRRAPMRAVPNADDGKTPVPTGRAGVDVVRAEAGQTSYSGTVIDAHDATPIAAARLVVIAPAFQGDGVVSRATSNERGEFVLDASHRSDARLVIEAPAHTKHEQALPLPGVLRIALVTRRRTLLERLVRWAQRTGAPFDAQPEPTPGHVRRAAFRAQDDEVEQWARGVETAAYGPAMVDEQLESQLVAGEPRGGRKLGV